MASDQGLVETGGYRVGYAEPMSTRGVASCVAAAIVSRADPRLHGLAHIFVQTIGEPGASRAYQDLPPADERVRTFLGDYRDEAARRALPPEADVTLFGGNFFRILPYRREKYLSFSIGGLDETVRRMFDAEGYRAVALPGQARRGLPVIGTAYVDELDVSLSAEGRISFERKGQEYLREALKPGATIVEAERF